LAHQEHEGVLSEEVHLEEAQCVEVHSEEAQVEEVRSEEEDNKK
jgi:hypothetical protein